MISQKDYFKFYVNYEQRKLRHKVDWNLAEEYSKKGLDIKSRMADRFYRLCEEEKPIILPEEKICFVRTVSNLPDVLTEQEKEEFNMRGCINNLALDYYGAIDKGLIEMKKTADEYAKRDIDGIIMLSDKYLEEAKRLGREDIVEVLTQVPRYPARNFREALQFFRILHYSIWLEGYFHNTVGRFDLNIWKYLKKDLDEGIHTRESALELLEDFFLSFNKDTELYTGMQQGDNGQSMMLGGIDKEGKDVFNLLSELCLEASYNNGLIDPKINLRVNKNTPIERFELATKLTKRGLGFPQYSNDDIVIPALQKLGYDYDDAANYTVAACWEFIIPNNAVEVVNIDGLSYPKCVDLALHSALKDCKDYDDFFEAVKKEIYSEAHQICTGWKNRWTLPCPLVNLLMPGADYLKAKYNNYGVHGCGISTAADSLAAIKKYVFDEKRISADTLIDAIDKDFEGYAELLHLLRYEAPKMGNNDDYVDSIAVELLDTFADSLKGYKNEYGGIFRAGTGSAMYYVMLADKIGASPDGRRKGEPFGANFSVSLFAKLQGPVSVIASMTKPHFENAINGGPLTLEFHHSVFADDGGIGKVAALVRTFILKGGHQLQLNTVNTEKLYDAQANPEKYRNLVVRVWGWSGYFVELDKCYQDHVIARQTYTI